MKRELDDYSAATDYLGRDPHANRELLIAMRYEPRAVVRVAWRNGAVVGALVRGPGPTGAEPEWIRLDADDQDAVAALLAQTDIGDGTVLSLHRPRLVAFVVQQYGFSPTGSGLYGYLVDRQHLVRQPNVLVRPLTLSDAALVERSACGWSRSYFTRLFQERRRPWAIVKDGAIICRASSGYPHANSEEVVGVWTHKRWRGRGFARALVGALAADILERAQFAAYTTTFDNHASQAVARAVGFQSCFAAESYVFNSAATSSENHTMVNQLAFGR